MRRILAIALLIAFGSPMAVPLFAAATTDPEASLPPCCRSHGKHHCAMMHMMLAASTSPTLAAPPCPLYPTKIAPLRIITASVAASLPQQVEFRRDPALPVATPCRAAWTFIASANLKRGPPASLA